MRLVVIPLFILFPRLFWRFVLRRVPLTFFALLLSASIAVPVFAQDRPKPDDAAKHDDEKTSPIPPEKTSATHHDGTLGGRTIHYTATAGTLLILKIGRAHV